MGDTGEKGTIWASWPSIIVATSAAPPTVEPAVVGNVGGKAKTWTVPGSYQFLADQQRDWKILRVENIRVSIFLSDQRDRWVMSMGADTYQYNWRVLDSQNFPIRVEFRTEHDAVPLAWGDFLFSAWDCSTSPPDGLLVPIAASMPSEPRVFDLAAKVQVGLSQGSNSRPTAVSWVKCVY